MPHDDFFERDRKQRGLGVPTQQDRERAFRAPREELLVPPGAIRFGTNPETARVVHFMPEQLSTGLHAVGASEMGKTNLFKNVEAELMEHRDRTSESFSVIDPMGPLARYALDLCVKRGESFAKNVFYFSLRGEGGYFPIFNPLRADRGIPFATHSFMEAVAKSRGLEKTTDTPLISETIEEIVKVLLFNELSLAEAVFFTAHADQHRAVRDLLMERVPDENTVSFWRDEIGRLGPRDLRYEVSPAGRRFKQFLQFPTVKNILGQTIPGLDVAALMDQGMVGIFDLGLDGTNLTEEAQQLMGALLVQEFKAVAMRRPSNISRPHFLLIDEFSKFVSHDVMTVFDQARQKGLRVILAHQGMDQLLLKDEDPRLLKAVLRIRQKIIFGAGLVDDQLDLARQAYAPWIDTDQVRLELKSTYFAPKGKWVDTETRTIVNSDVESDTENEMQGSGAMAGSGIVTPPLGDPTSTEQSTSFDSAGSGRGRGKARGRAEGVTRGQQYITEYEEREQVSSVQFEEADNLIFKRMQELYRQPTGTCSVVTGKEEPQRCEVPLARELGVSDAERERFLARVYEKPLYLPTDEAVRQIKARHAKLIEAAPVQPRVVPTPGEAASARRQKPYRTKKKA